jgi:hypothetical protein
MVEEAHRAATLAQHTKPINGALAERRVLHGKPKGG